MKKEASYTGGMRYQQIPDCIAPPLPPAPTAAQEKLLPTTNPTAQPAQPLEALTRPGGDAQALEQQRRSFAG